MISRKASQERSNALTFKQTASDLTPVNREKESEASVGAHSPRGLEKMSSDLMNHNMQMVRSEYDDSSMSNCKDTAGAVNVWGMVSRI